MGERFGNAHGVGNDAVITQVKEYDALRVEAEFHTSVISYENHKENGKRITANNDYQTFNDIPNHEALRNVQIILGGTLATHTCIHCGGSGREQVWMMRFAVLSDGSCDLGPELAAEKNVQVVPFWVTFDGTNYQKEIEELPVRDFYQMMVDDPHTFPKTAQPSRIWWRPSCHTPKRRCRCCF